MTLLLTNTKNLDQKDELAIYNQLQDPIDGYPISKNASSVWMGQRRMVTDQNGSLRELQEIKTSLSKEEFEKQAPSLGLNIKPPEQGEPYSYLDALKEGPTKLFWKLWVDIKYNVIEPIIETVSEPFDSHFRIKGTMSQHRVHFVGDARRETAVVDETIEETKEWTIYGSDPKEVKIVKPLMGAVKPYLQIIKYDKNQKRDIDLAYYFRPINITWSDEQLDKISTFTMLCAYRPEFLKLNPGLEIVPLIGTHDNGRLSLGSFFFKKIKVSMAAGNMTCELVFTAMNYGSAVANNVITKKDVLKYKSYEAFLKEGAKRLGFKLQISKDVIGLENPPYNLPEERQYTFLILLNKICSENNWIFYIRKKTIEIQNLAQSKVKRKYRTNISTALSFVMENDPTNSFKEVQVYCYNPSVGFKSAVHESKENIVGRAVSENKQAQESGNVFVTIRNDIKTRSKADQAARILLKRLNSSEVKATLTLPNCIIFAGHDIEIIQDLRGFETQLDPFEFYIKRAHHTIGVSGWKSELELVKVNIDNKADQINQLQAVRKLRRQWHQHVRKFRKIVYDDKEIKKFVVKFVDLYKDKNNGVEPTLKDFLDAFVFPKKLTHPKYQSDIDNTLDKALQQLRKDGEKIQKSLKDYQYSLQALGETPPSGYEQEFWSRLPKTANQLVFQEAGSIEEKLKEDGS